MESTNELTGFYDDEVGIEMEGDYTEETEDFGGGGRFGESGDLEGGASGELAGLVGEMEDGVVGGGLVDWFDSCPAGGGL